MSTAQIRRGNGFTPFVQVIFLIGLLGLWYWAVESKSVSPFLIPHPADVWHELGILLANGTIPRALGLTLYQVAVAFGASTVVGLIAGFYISRSRYWVDVFTPIFSALYAVPVVLLLPLFILMLGLGPNSKIAVGISNCFFPIVLSAIVGFGKVDAIYKTAARSMGASPGQTFWHVMLPAALPAILTGLRMGFIVCFLSIVGAETIASYGGLGREIVDRAETLNTPPMFAFLMVVICLSFIINNVLTYIEQRGSWQ